MDNFKDIIEETSSKHYNVVDRFKENTVEDNKEICKKESLPFAIGAFSITGDLNIGMMLRSASLLGAQDFFIFGRRKYDRRSTVGAENYIDVHRGYDMTAEDIVRACGEKYYPMFVEQFGVCVSVMNWELLEDCHQWADGPMFIFGSESDGIPEDVIEEVHDRYLYSGRISIPQRGVLRSFNVSSAMSIVCWEYVSKMWGCKCSD